ncbi:Unconventional Myosin-Ixb [Manis pentadactyla]|nr:Unconventional Myosin-Ixb [Manis pentadactyla]
MPSEISPDRGAGARRTRAGGPGTRCAQQVALRGCDWAGWENGWGRRAGKGTPTPLHTLPCPPGGPSSVSISRPLPWLALPSPIPTLSSAVLKAPPTLQTEGGGLHACPCPAGAGDWLLDRRGGEVLSDVTSLPGTPGSCPLPAGSGFLSQGERQPTCSNQQGVL